MGHLERRDITAVQAVDLESLRRFVVLAEERNFGRAAVRLHMTKTPMSRAVKQLEDDLGVTLLDRSSSPVTLTSAGTALYHEARVLLEQAEHLRARVAAATGTATITVGILSDSAEQAASRLAVAFRQLHPAVRLLFHQADFADPTAGLRAGLADVAVTLAPFDDTGISTQVLYTCPVGVVLRADDPLAGRESLRLRDLADRRWFRLPDGTDPIWRAHWEGAVPSREFRDGPVVRTVREGLQAVLRAGSVGLAPLSRELPDGLTAVPLADMPPSRLILAWNRTSANPLVRSFTHVAASIYRGEADTTIRSEYISAF